ncbi:predicted protein [Nematostella vectensis]|uniref:Ig-like domain-containing protein n=1 Tax=Nematostella vectensis TaxID=45351 RepID=A7T291_NEMVE|nr:predicted protein [Nematostella vectensis]|eukprot:XP_001622024.1 hypothetical protein NEMVEDRAFT_v1g221269 [Nematostella vectensis]
MAGDADKPRKTNRSKWNILIVCHIVFSIVLAALVIHHYVKNESRFKELGEKLERCETIRDLASEMTVSVSTSTPRVVQGLSAMLRRSPQENETSEISRTTTKTKIKAGFIEAQEGKRNRGNESQKICTDLRGPRGPPGSRGPRGFTGTPGEQGKPGGSHAVGGQQGEGCSGTMLGGFFTSSSNLKNTKKSNNMLSSYPMAFVPVPRRIQMLCPSKVPHPITQSTLVIKETRRSDTGTYTCRARNMMGARDYHVDLIVQGNQSKSQKHRTHIPVAIVVRPENQTELEGNEVSLNCNASGIPAPSITWYRQDGGYMPVNHRVVNGDLIISNITKSLEGTYDKYLIKSFF